jgi:hypothetical protein
MTFGEYPLIGPKDARELHYAAKKILASGVNPMAERKAEAEAKQEEVRAIPQRIQPESARFRLGAFELSNLSFIGNLSV